MRRFGFLARKSGPAEKPIAPSATNGNPLELDEELFSGLGGENESPRKMLVDANDMINELDSIKAAVGKLVYPVSKTLRDFEAEKTEKVGLQSALNTTRAAYGKLRNEVGDIEKRFAAADRECKTLRQDLVTTQNQRRALEATNAKEAGERIVLRDENRRLDDRLVAADKRTIALESDLDATRQRLLAAEDEKRAQLALLDQASVETARLSCKLAETEASFHAVLGRLRLAEANFTETSTECARLAAALDLANERHERERTNQSMRFDALKAQTTALEKVAADAHELLLARAEQIREHERRNGDLATERNALQARLSDVQAVLLTRESELKEVEHARRIYLERNATLARAFTAKEATLAQAEDAKASLHERIGALETAYAADKQAAEKNIEEFNAALRREELKRSVVEAALQTARTDFSRTMREVMALQRNPLAQAEPVRPQVANAA